MLHIKYNLCFEQYNSNKISFLLQIRDKNTIYRELDIY